MAIQSKPGYDSLRRDSRPLERRDATFFPAGSDHAMVELTSRLLACDAGALPFGYGDSLASYQAAVSPRNVP